MTVPRLLKGHTAAATCCIASRCRPGLIATAGEICSSVQLLPWRSWEVITGGLDSKLVMWDFSKGHPKEIMDLVKKIRGPDVEEHGPRRGPAILSVVIVEMRVHMDCPGCETKIMKTLSKLDGVDNIDIDMKLHKVTVTGWADQQKVLKKVRKTGCKAELWPFPYKAEYHAYSYSDNASGYVRSPSRYFMAEPSVSTYNYRKHGYNGHEHGYYHQPPSSDEHTTTIFSDDNATGCSVM